MKRWAVFISGRGSNLQALGEIQHEIDIALCVTSHQYVAGVQRARRLGIPVLKIQTKLGETEWARIHQELLTRGIDRIFLLGFMRLLPKSFVDLWQGKIFNLHPSLLPKYPGKEAIESSYQNADAMGVSVHHVIAEMDAGEIVIQKKICEKACAPRHPQSLERSQFWISQAEQNLVRRVATWN
jgi:phosphoribosylglycinamide formyltransferase-1